ncbi:MAG: hypothetical protein NZM16_10530 [Thermoflexus sp.]|uniref:hypothetical protein n=1 Tax=Thermoflexus sp. TaxID=1969742 RepID=UPI0025E9ADCC|nr:hypothetical protein [Thermoflexus sp.]MCS6964466.1 hypothetical protein [Thermoflexus sp.]
MFTVRDFEDLIRLLDQRPEWREALRQRILTRELLELPAQIQALRAETERRFQRVEEQIAALAEAQRRHYEEFVAHRQEFLAHRQETDRRFAELAEAQQRTERELLKLIRNQDLLQSTLDRFAQIIGPIVEERLIPALRVWLESQGGTPLGPVVAMTLDGIGEVDGALPVRWPDGREGWILVSVKAKVWPRSIEDFAKDILQNPQARAALRDKGVSDLVWPIVFGLTVDDRAPRTAEQEKIGLLSSQQGMIVPPIPWSLEKGNYLSDT